MVQNRFSLLSRTVTFVQRYRQILFVLLRWGFDDLIATLRLEQYTDGGWRSAFRKKRAPDVERLSRAARMRLAIEELGPTFVKMGQALSTRSDLLPQDVLLEFAHLQDHVQVFPSSQAKAIVERELGRPCEEIFSDFEEHPLAAGSIGQVHRARTVDGQEVAVKIQRPDIRKQIQVDLEIIHYFATLMERHLELGQLHKPTRITDEFARTLEQELDYSIEAANIHRFSILFEGESTIYVPEVFRDLSSDKVLTMEFVKGIKPSEREDLDLAGLDPKKIAASGADLVINQVFIHGFFHADPHPGNLLILKNNVVCFLDFGMMGRIDHQSREMFADLLVSLVGRDESKAVDILLKLTHGHTLVDRASLEREISELIDHYFYLPLKELQVGKLIRRIMDVTVKYELGIPAQYFLLIKAISQIEDLGRTLDGSFDFTERAGPIMRRLLMNRYHPKRMMRDFYETGSDLIYLIKDMPGEVRELLKQARQGKLKIEMEHQGLHTLGQTFERISNRITSAIVLASLIVGSSLLVHAKVPPVWYNIPIIGLVGYVVSGFLGLSLLRSIWKSRDH